jgi:hypothetical protein
VHISAHVPPMQYGADASHDVLSLQSSAMHWFPRQISPCAHAWSIEIPCAAQSAASLQQRSGFGFVHAADTNTNIVITTLIRAS